MNNYTLFYVLMPALKLTLETLFEHNPIDRYIFANNYIVGYEDFIYSTIHKRIPLQNFETMLLTDILRCPNKMKLTIHQIIKYYQNEINNFIIENPKTKNYYLCDLYYLEGYLDGYNSMTSDIDIFKRYNKILK